MEHEVSSRQWGSGQDDPVSVFVYAEDVIVERGVRSLLTTCDRLRMVDDPDQAVVAIVAVGRLDAEIERIVGALQRNGRPKVVALVADVDDDDLLSGAEVGLSGVVRRRDGEGPLLAAVLAAAKGDAAYPADLVARLVNRLAAGRRQGALVLEREQRLTLSERETAVLKLLADGLDTAEIAVHLSYSERTIKGIIHDLTTRLHLKNRSHAVAYAMRAGLI